MQNQFSKTPEIQTYLIPQQSDSYPLQTLDVNFSYVDFRNPEYDFNLKVV